jgi:plasmid stability protein
MPALQVRDFPPDLYEELRSRAKQEHRSVSQQTIVAVREHLLPLTGSAARQQPSPEHRRAARGARRKAYFEGLDRFPATEIAPGFPSPAEIVRQTRDER